MKLANRDNIVKNVFENIDPKKGISDFERDFLDEIAISLGSGTWEIGPDIFDPNKWFFSLSGARNLSEVNSFRTHLSELPMVEGWVFYPALPPKNWNIFFIYESLLEIDGCNWRYCITTNDKRIELEMRPPKDTLEINLLQVSKILVVGEIGEENLLKYIDNISISKNACCDREFSGFAENFSLRFPDLYYSNVIKRKNCGVIL